MKFRHALAPCLALLALSGYGQKDTAPASGRPAPQPVATAAAARTVEISANDTMRFSLATIPAKAGEQIKVVFTNNGAIPKEAMGHNWVLLKAGVDAAAFAAAAAAAKDNDYIPPALADQVLASTPILGPRKSAEVTFTVPAAGEFVFLCTFPAHFAIGMKGTLVAK
ncbi:MAG: hypothetical protein RLZZ15_402 [Verrucomicrobiota bacterium]